MDFFKAWVMTISGFVIISVICEMLLPKQSIRKYGKLVLGFMLIVLVMKPFFNIDKAEILRNEFALEYNEGVITAERGEMVKNAFKARLEKNIENSLKDRYGEVAVDVEISADDGGEFIIEKIQVGNISEEKRKEVASEIIKNYGCDEIGFV